ncbi:MAG: hypothetical protein VR66_26245 [Peptococcaceae bacterium BRH_c23]|nr:MAG: hypothetical protein VR66_26245 [Peptococcaceae bacterium BRH_c23]KJS86882.1 MAG: hypothetical protein JL57_15185 [Desulfosporosinus sp. BICA1-9]HBW37019.1 hypothetical protein [Desulfosporosinus sp.]
MLCAEYLNKTYQNRLLNPDSAHNQTRHIIAEQMPNTDFNQSPELIEKFVPWSKELPANCIKTKK